MTGRPFLIIGLTLFTSILLVAGGCQPTGSMSFRPTLVGSPQTTRAPITPENVDRIAPIGILVHPPSEFTDPVVEITGVSFSPDGRFLASGSTDKMIQLWDVEHRRHNRTLYNGMSQVFRISSVVFSPDGRMLAAGVHALPSPRSLDDNGSVKLLNVTSGRVTHSFYPQATETVSQLAWSPDGALIAAVLQAASPHLQRPGLMKVWEVATGREVFSLHQDILTSIAFSFDGQLLAIGDGQCVRVYQVPSWQEVQRLQQQSEIHSVAFSPNGQLLAAGRQGGLISFWEINGPQEVLTIQSGGQGVPELIFSPDGRLLVAMTTDGELQLWDVLTGQHLRAPALNGVSASDVAFSPDGTLLATGNSQGILDGEKSSSLPSRYGTVRSTQDLRGIAQLWGIE